MRELYVRSRGVWSLVLYKVCPVRVDVGVLTCCVGHSLTEHGLFLRELV